MRFTTHGVRALKPRERLYWLDDETLPGFRVGVTPKGVKSFAVRLRRGGRGNRSDTVQTIGRFGVLTLDQARAKATELLSRWRLGEDLVADRRARLDAVTVRQLSELFLAEIEGRRKPGTVREYRRLLTVEVVPSFGNVLARDLTRAKVAKWHSRIGGRAPIVANRSIRLLRTLYRWGVTRGELPEGVNPTLGIAFFPEQAKQRFLSEAEVLALGDALLLAENSGVAPDPNRALYAERRANGRPQKTIRPANPWAIGAIRFLLLTGWREREALTLRWSEVDLSTGRVSLRETKTGQSYRTIGKAALEILSGLTRVEGSPYVFPGRTPDEPLVEIKHVWQAVRHSAGLGDVRLHDLRHTFASAAMEGGTPLWTTGKLLGHRDVKSTARYSHLADDPMRRAADATSAALSARLLGQGASNGLLLVASGKRKHRHS